MDLLYKLAKAGRSRTNACRNLRKLLLKSGRMLPVEIDCVSVRVRYKKPKVRVIDVWWPILKMKDFARALFDKAPGALLGGHRLCDEELWKKTFTTFWAEYQTIDETHPFFETGFSPETSVPIYVHGDEGRGLRSRPFMVLSWQTAVPCCGLDGLNEKGFFGRIRYLFWVCGL